RRHAGQKIAVKRKEVERRLLHVAAPGQAVTGQDQVSGQVDPAREARDVLTKWIARRRRKRPGQGKQDPVETVVELPGILGEGPLPDHLLSSSANAVVRTGRISL